MFVIVGLSQAASETGLRTVTLAWDGLGDGLGDGVAGYRLHYGVASGLYTQSIDAGVETHVAVPELSRSTSYFFAVTSYDENGLDSLFSDEIRWAAQTPTVSIRIGSQGQPGVSVSGLPGHSYSIQSMQVGGAWTTLGVLTLGPTGILEFLDRDALRFPNRFYRVVELETSP